MYEVLVHRTRSIDADLKLEYNPNGYRIIWDDTKVIAMDSPDDFARISVWVYDIRENYPNAQKIAHIGGGFCIASKLLGPDFQHDIYEIESALGRFAPDWATFIPGDWNTTLSGTYDVIIADLNEFLTDDEMTKITQHLALEGKLITNTE